MSDEKPQPMIELKIRWDGPVQGLSEKRLSVGLFGYPLRRLLFAIRRTASNMLRDAGTQQRADTGRFAAEADQIDIEIVEVLKNSSGIESFVSVQTPQGQQAFWPEGLAADAVDRVLQNIERESKGAHRSKSVREYLRSLPPGLTHQDYWLIVDGETRSEIHLGPITLPADLFTLPYLVETEGRLIGVGFEPGRNFVRIKASDPSGTEMTFAATQEQVENALAMRDESVRVLGLKREPMRLLLQIQLRREPRPRLDIDTYVFQKWHDLLARLAQ